ncbi:MAG: diaminobutyrate acetyltransferase [Candidatus Bathyarchaeota archaeon]|nr:diaminobutyrate acetyltransferase [Candidatus Bathyarchaeota archaeon]
MQFKIRKVTVEDIKEVYRLLVANKPLVGLNSRYTYFLLARDFSDTCIVAEHDGEIVAFSSGYVPPKRQGTFFNWETVVHPKHRGNGLQKLLLLQQIKMANATYLEATVNPSNEASKRSFTKLAKMLNTKCETKMLFSEEDFENDGHEAEVLYRIGPISKTELDRQLASF